MTVNLVVEFSSSYERSSSVFTFHCLIMSGNPITIIIDQSCLKVTAKLILDRSGWPTMAWKYCKDIEKKKLQHFYATNFYLLVFSWTLSFVARGVPELLKFRYIFSSSWLISAIYLAAKGRQWSDVVLQAFCRKVLKEYQIKRHSLPLWNFPFRISVFVRHFSSRCIRLAWMRDAVLDASLFRKASLKAQLNRRSWHVSHMSY